MPAIATHERWLRHFVPRDRRDDPWSPTFSAWRADHEPEGLSQQFRAAFTFLRRHGDGRYGAQSLMKLLTAADQLDADTFDQNTIPKVAVVEVPYSYDDETEVKSGGIVGVAVVLEDGRLMMAVNRQTRRRRVGSALLGWVNEYIHTNPVVWVHQANIIGGQFCLSRGLQPREVNARGAVAYTREYVRTDDDLAVEATSDYELEEAMMMASHRRGQSRPRRPRMRLDYPDQLAPDPAAEVTGRWRITTPTRDTMYVEMCDDQDCYQCRADDPMYALEGEPV